jgi:PAS domain S-box-containing protein
LSPQPRILLLAPPGRRPDLERRLAAGPTPVTITSAAPEAAGEAFAAGKAEVVVLAPNRAPTPTAAGAFARACLPVPLVLVWPGTPAPRDIPDVAACVVGGDRLGEVVTAVLTRHAATPGATALRDILARVTDPLLLVSSAGHVVAANPPFAELTGWRDAALVGQPLASLVADDVAARVAATEGHEWTVADVAVRTRGGEADVVADVRGSIVRLAAGRATWLLRFRRTPAGRLPASPEAAAGAIDALTRRATRAGHRIGGAHVRLIGIGRARQILGERWPRFQQHIQLVCESTIDHELGPDDVAMATKTGDYLVCFACRDDDEADRRADRLQATIDRRLFGQDGVEIGGTQGGRAALNAVSVEVDAAVLPPAADAAPQHVAERFARECATRRRERLAEFNERLENLRTSGDLEILPVASLRGTLPSVVRAYWFPGDHARLQRLAERANKLDDLRLALDLRRLALVDKAESDGVMEEASAIVDLHVATIERRKSWDALLPVVQDLSASTRRWLVPNLVGVPEDIYAGRLRDAILTLKPFSRTQAITLTARQLAGLDLTLLPCRLFLMTAGEAASALDGDLPQRIRERLDLARAKLAIDGGSAALAQRFGADLRTVRDDTDATAA